MKKLITLLVLSLTFVGCSQDGGGVTSDPPAPTPPPVVVVPDPAFNLVLSDLKIVDASTNAVVTAAQVNEHLKLVLTARDQFGNAMPNLSVKMGLRYAGIDNQAPTDAAAGKYTLDLGLISGQGDFTAYVKVNDVEQNLHTSVNVSYCNGLQDNTAAPFFTKATINSEEFYVICTPSQLANAASSAYANYNLAMGVALDLSTYYVDGNSDGSPDNQFKIGSSANPYTGHFLGSGFPIKGFTYKSSTTDDVGLFGAVGNGAKLDQVVLVEANINGRNNVGVLAGKVTATNSNVEISSDIVDNSVIKGTGSKIGGLIGYANASGAAINVSQNYVKVTENLNGSTQSVTQVGGLIGHNSGSKITSASVFATYTYTDKTFVISKVGGLIGEDTSVNGSDISDSTIYSTQTYSSGTQVGCLIGYANGSKVADMSGGSTCIIDQTGSTPSDITLSGGVFGEIANSASINNVNSFITASHVSYTFGGLAGSITSSAVTNSSVSGSISGSGSNMGGIAGISINSSYTDIISYVNLTLSGGVNSIGGVIGNSENNTLTRVFNGGIINAPNASVVGGLIGYAVNALTITDSYNTGNITADFYIGGMIGQTSDDAVKSVSRVYNAATLQGSDLVGGLIGSIDGVGTKIKDSFSIGPIQNLAGMLPTNSGGLVGEVLMASSGNFTNDFFLSEATLTPASCSAGPGCADVIAGTTDTNTAAGLSVDLAYYADVTKSPLSSWDFVNVWGVYSPYAPFLK